MRPSALLLAALFVTPLAGCLGTTAATAGDVTPAARRIAEAWQPDAALEAVAGIELKELPPIVAQAIADSGKDSPQAQLLRYHDDNVGDGRTAAWLFGFRSGGRELLLVLGADGRELMRDEESAHGTPDTPLGEVAIDSDDAMRLAADHNDTFADLRGRAAIASLALAQGRDGPVWVIAIGASFDDESDMGFAVVDATSGNVTVAPDFDDAFESVQPAEPAEASSVQSPYYRPHANRTFLRTETGSERGTLSVVDPDGGNPFDVELAGHSKLRFQLNLPRSAPPTQATATVTAPDGRTTTLVFTAAVTGGAPATAELANPQPGSYTVAIHLDVGALQQYEFSWCAPGSRMAAADPSSACGQA